jgi:ATP-dependent Clp protease adapter protein ClpS
MPPGQVAAIVLFWAQVICGIAAVIVVGQFTYSQWNRVGRVNVTSLLSNHPRWLLGLMAFSTATGIMGLWLTVHIPRPVTPAPCPVETKNQNPAPALPTPDRSTPDHSGSKMSKHSPQHGSPTKTPSGGVTQGGNGNQQTVTQAPITQENSGGCNQQVIGGNNNSNVCATPARKLTDDQKSKLAGVAEEIPKSIMVVIGSADDAEFQNYAEEIRQVFLRYRTTRARGTMFGWHPKGVFIVVNPEDESQTRKNLAMR